jgi:16S rRNA (uracil1498-N3)-methyltransferase
MRNRFYVNWSLNLGPVRITGPEAHHLSTVCRLRAGDAVCLFNGDGREYQATVVSSARRAVELHIVSSTAPDRELGFRVEVAAPLPKGDRAQFLIEKLTELGVVSFVPLRTQRSVVHPGETRRDKLQRCVVEASKQCGRNILLQVQPVTDWSSFCASKSLPATRILAHPWPARQGGGESQEKQSGDQGHPPSTIYYPLSWPPGNKALAVGPEGGFTTEEVDAAKAAGWQVTGLGPRILRVETAALVLAAWVTSPQAGN